MKKENIAIALAAVAVALAVYLARRPAPSVTYVQAANRTDVESVLTGIGALASGVGDAVGSVVQSFQPRIGMGSGSSSGS